MMDLLRQAHEGFATVDADTALKEQALHHLGRWLTEEEFAPYWPQLAWLIQEKQWASLLDRFYQILPFGTGGRRGAVGIGPNRMNLWTLGASVQGHCEYLKERFPEVQQLRVVVAYDVRQFEDQRHNYNQGLPNPVLHLSSRDFARHAVGIYTANGIHAYILPETSSRYLATPELSFIIRHLTANGGLNISASHNPPDDNGGKFYDERGGQPVPPDDQIMADLVDQVTAIRFFPWPEAVRSGRVHFLDESAHHAYIDLCRRQSLIPPPRFDEITIVFTPLHGVGAMTAMETLEKQGFHVLPVEAQMKPDGQFPNVTKSPNPEVPESLDRALALAQEQNADLLLATDPDADRLGAMAPEREGRRQKTEDRRQKTEDSGEVTEGKVQESGSQRLLTPHPSPFFSRPSLLAPAWRYLNGNMLAALLTHFKLAKLAEKGQLPRNPIVIKTLVTSSLVTRIARHFQAQVVENLLVGFKYVADVLWQLEQHRSYEDVTGTPEDFVLACEESHGLLVTPHIRDKDAAASALLLAELALAQKRRGQTVIDYQHDLEKQFGYFHHQLRTIALAGIAGKQTMARMLSRLREHPPTTIGGLAVTAFEDLQSDQCWLGPIKGATDRAARNFLYFRFGDQARLAMRPSGTEPKAKVYIEACSPPCPLHATPEQWQQTCREVDNQAERLAEDFMRLTGVA